MALCCFENAKNAFERKKELEGDSWDKVFDAASDAAEKITQAIQEENDELKMKLLETAQYLEAAAHDSRKAAERYAQELIKEGLDCDERGSEKLQLTKELTQLLTNAITTSSSVNEEAWNQIIERLSPLIRPSDIAEHKAAASTDDHSGSELKPLSIDQK